MKAKLQLQRSVYEEQIRTALHEHWHVSAAGDTDAEHDIYDDDVICDYPPVGRANPGRKNLQALRSHHPGKPSGFEVKRILGNGDVCVTHSMTAGDLALRAGSVERTGARAVTESLSVVRALVRVPLIDDHLHRHLASPNAGDALLLVGSYRQSPVTTFAVHRKRRWNTTPAVSLPQPHVQYLSDC
jgi:hypothetical protein